jgi:hypothetical protein
MNVHFQNSRGYLSFLLLIAAIGQGSAAEVKVVDHGPPKEIDAAIREKLQTKAIQLSDGGQAIYEFWFANEIPLKSKSDDSTKALQAIQETTLLAAVQVGKGQHDYKDNDIAPGVYTMRFGLQPQDGDHLGSAEFPYFVVLIPAKADTKPDGMSDFKTMTKASGKATASGHPIVLSLRPAATEKGYQPKLTEPAPENKAVRFQVPARLPTGPQKEYIVFDLVYQGKGKT